MATKTMPRRASSNDRIIFRSACHRPNTIQTHSKKPPNLRQSTAKPLEAMKDRIAKATVIEHAGIIKPDVFYDTGEDPEEAIDTPSDESQNGDAQASDTPEMPQPRRTEQPKPRSTQPNALEEMTESARQLKAANDALRKKATLLKKAIVGILVFIVVVLLILIAFKKW